MMLPIMKNRARWGSRLGFMFAVAGSAIGLANIWRFPYMVGNNGGAAFIAVYLISLLLIGIPVFLAEVLIGRKTQKSPSIAFSELGKTRAWEGAGMMTIITGFIVSSFYAAIAGWILGYLVEAVLGNLSSFHHISEPIARYEQLVGNPLWGVSFHAFFVLICTLILYLGVRGGIERGNKIMMPALFFVLIVLVVKGLTLPNASEGTRFLFSPDWKALTPGAILTALGQAFFTLSLGQGTMVTYGSYLSQKENLISSSLLVVLMDTLVSIFAAIAVFTIVFSEGLSPNAGPGLLFHTLPWVFSEIPGGYLFALLFFLLVTLAAITSEISAMEPTIAHMIDKWGWKRHRAVVLCGLGVFILGVPSALSYSLLKDYTIMGDTFLDLVHNFSSDILIPFGGFVAVVLVGWRWGANQALDHLAEGGEGILSRSPLFRNYLRFSLKYSAPILMIGVFMHALGVI